MHLAVLVIAVLLMVACAEMGLFPSPFCRVLIRIDGGRVSFERGSLSARTREFLSDAIRGAGVRGGFVSVSGNSRVRFSPGIPEESRQQIRNILLNL